MLCYIYIALLPPSVYNLLEFCHSHTASNCFYSGNGLPELIRIPSLLPIRINPASLRRNRMYFPDEAVEIYLELAFVEYITQKQQEKHMKKKKERRGWCISLFFLKESHHDINYQIIRCTDYSKYFLCICYGVYCKQLSITSIIRAGAPLYLARCGGVTFHGFR